MNVSFAIIVAVDQKFGMGQKGLLPWHLPAELKHFKEVTTCAEQSRKNVVIMGRKTWESIPEKFRPLPNRHNIVLTRNSDLVFPPGVYKAENLDRALVLASEGALKNDLGKIFVIGGAELFQLAIKHPACRKIYLTRITTTFDCDCFFPPIPPEFKETERSPMHFENNVQFCFITYKK